MRKNVGKKKLLLTVLSALTLSLAATIGAFADESDTSKLVSGTKINGVGVGGLTPDEAKARIEGFYAGEYTLNIKEKGGKEESIKGSDIGYQVTVSGSIQNILDSQNATGRVAGPSGENTHTMEVSAQYNEEALNNKISNLSCISGGSIVTTKDASISAYEEGKEFTIVPAVQGNDVDPEKTKQVITAVVRAGSRELSLEETGCYRTVGVWESDENLKALCAAMNSRRTKQLRYVFGDASEVLSGETMELAITLVTIHAGCAIIFWPLSFVLPNALRAANDVKFTMVVSILSMACWRLGFSYLLCVRMGWGAVGVWVAMVIDWTCRVTCFVLRFRSGAWKTKYQA